MKGLKEREGTLYPSVIVIDKQMRSVTDDNASEAWFRVTIVTDDVLSTCWNDRLWDLQPVMFRVDFPFPALDWASNGQN